MSDEPSVAAANVDERQIIFNLMDLMRQSTAQFRQDDFANNSALVAAAATTFAGSIFGQLVALGLEDNDRNRRRTARKVLEQQFDAGVRLGIAMANHTKASMKKVN